MAPLDLDVDVAPVATCSKTRTPSGFRSGRAPGRQRSNSKGKTPRVAPSRDADEPRGRTLTRDFELVLEETPSPDIRHGSVWGDFTVDFIGGLVEGAVVDYAGEVAEREDDSDEAYQVFDDDCPAIVQEIQECSIDLVMGEGELLGLHTSPCEQVLTIDRIDGGVVQKWNVANASQQVSIGDAIVEVNGQRGVKSISQALREAVTRAPNTPSFKLALVVELTVTKATGADSNKRCELEIEPAALEQPRHVVHVPQQYTIDLIIGEGDCIGLHTSQCGQSLTIEQISEGIVKKWNAANPSQQVSIGDSIVEANGHRDGRQISRVYREAVTRASSTSPYKLTLTIEQAGTKEQAAKESQLSANIAAVDTKDIVGSGLTLAELPSQFENESDYPDSEDVVDSNRPSPRNSNSVFLDYVHDMFEAAFTGNVLEFFGSPDEATPRGQVAETDNVKLPDTASLKPCSRPSFRKRLRPREIPPGAEEFPMDCLPSTPACLSAPEGPGVEVWAERMQRAAIAEEVAEDICKSVFVFDVQLDGDPASPLDHTFCQEETIAAVAPVAPTAKKPEGRAGSARARAFQRVTQDVPQATAPTTPRRPNSPRFRLASALAFATDETAQPNVCRTPRAEQPKPTPPQCSPSSATPQEPQPPDGPHPSKRPPSCRRPRPSSQRATSRGETFEKSPNIEKKVMSARRHVSPTPQAFADVMDRKFNFELAAGHAAKSAMAMDLGEAVVSSATQSSPREQIPFSWVSKGSAPSSGITSSTKLPAFSMPASWSFDTRKAHDVL